MVSKRKTYVNNSVFLLFLVVTAVSLGVIQYRERSKSKSVEQEVSSLTAQQKELESRNKQIADSLNFLYTTSAKERIARGQLNMKKDGETVVSFSDPAVVSDTQNTQAMQTSNRMKWWSYFFNQQ